MVEWLQAGADDYLVKPFSAAELLVRIEAQGRRKRAEEKLGESEHRVRMLAEAIPQPIWSCLPDGIVDHCNQRWMDYTGLTLQDMQNYGWTKSLHPDDVEPMVKAWREAKSQGKPSGVEQRLQESTAAIAVFCCAPFRYIRYIRYIMRGVSSCRCARARNERL